MTKRNSTGEPLESRVQRLFLAQGIYSERYLRVTTGERQPKKTATDIDVLLSEYSSAFHLNRSHVECKGGKHFHILDRVFWMHGVKDLLGASASYLVLSEHDQNVMQFARDLGIELLTIDSVEKMEESYGIPEAIWPCRSNCGLFSPILSHWRRAAKEHKDTKPWSALAATLAFIEEESWLDFRFGLLNKLLRHFENLAGLAKDGALDTDCLRHSCTYCVAALVVRLSQYLMFACRDVLTMGAVTRSEYLRGRLTYGDQDPHSARTVVGASVAMIKAALAEHNVQPSLKWEPESILSAPTCTDNFVELIVRFVQTPSESRYVTIAAEAFHFGADRDGVGKFPRLAAAVKAGSEFAALIRGFVVQSFEVPAEFIEPFDAQKALASANIVGGAR